MRGLALIGVGCLTACDIKPIGPICIPIGGGASCQTWMCPPGETCSDKTPNGLQFSWAQAGDDIGFFTAPPLLDTARGGVQTISFSGLGGLPYDVDVIGDAVTAEKLAGDAVKVTGIAVGSSTVRIVEPDTGLLYGEVGLGVDEVTDAYLAAGTYWYGPEPSILWGGGGLHAVYALHGVSGRLVDENMQIALPAGAWRESWDTSYLPDPLPSTFTLPATLADGTPVTAIAVTAPDVDHLEWIPLFEAMRTSQITVGGADTYPFQASIAGITIAGATPNVAATGGIELTSAHGMFVSFRGVTVGTGHLSVAVGSARLDYDIAVVAAH